MKKYCFFCVLFIAFSFARGQYQFQTLTSEKVGPGVVYKKMIEPTQPWSIQVLTIDLSNPYLSIETVKARDRLKGLETTSSMAARKDHSGHYIVGAVNGDFFDNTGTPINVQVAQGQLLRPPNFPPTIAFDASDTPAIHTVSFDAVMIHHKSQHRIHSINMTRKTDQLVLYNTYMGGSTQTNQWGTEVMIRPLEKWLVNDTLLCVAEQKQTQRGDMTIPAGKAVLSGHGSASQVLATHVAVGDTLKLWLGITPGQPKLQNMVGGYIRLLKDGKHYVDTSYLNHNKPSFTYVRHPRTAIGYSEDKQTLYMVTVDGRQRLSAGMNLTELADFMLSLGAFDALNLDGGGSTTMVVRHEIKNSPSDYSGERAVCNAVLVVAETPPSPLLSINMTPDSTRLYAGETVALQVTAKDTFLNPIPLRFQEVDVSVDPLLGMLSTQGVFTAGNTQDSGYVYVNKNGLKDSTFVTVKSIESYKISPSVVVTDTMSTVAFQTEIIDSDGETHYIEPQWSVLDPHIGTINENGVFMPFHQGVTQVISRYLTFQDTALVRIEIGTDILRVDSLESVEKWHFSQENCESDCTRLTLSQQTSTMGRASLRIDYRYTYQRRQDYWLFLDSDQTLFGIPDTLWIDLKLDSLQHKIYFFVCTADDREFRLFPRPHPQHINSFNKVGVALKPPPGKASSEFIFPLTLKRIAIRLDNTKQENQRYSGTLYLDNLRASYPTKTAIAHRFGKNNTHSSFHLYQNYPNPFNDHTVIKLEMRKPQEIDLMVYDILGRKVTTLFSGLLHKGVYRFLFRANQLSSGIYFLRVDPPLVQPRKMIFTK